VLRTCTPERRIFLASSKMVLNTWSSAGKKDPDLPGGGRLPPPVFSASVGALKLLSGNNDPRGDNVLWLGKERAHTLPGIYAFIAIGALKTAMDPACLEEVLPLPGWVPTSLDATQGQILSQSPTDATSSR